LISGADPIRTERILLVRLSAIGDVVHALHGVAALRAARPDASLGFLVEDRAASLLRGHPDLDRVHVYPRKRWQRGLGTRPAAVAREAGGLLAEMRAARYDAAVDLQGNLKGGILAGLSGARRRIGLAAGFGREGNHLFQTERVALPDGPVHRVDRVLALLRPLGVEGAGGTLRIHVPEADREAPDRFLARHGLADGEFAALHPGTSVFGIYKRWPAERFGELAAGLFEEFGLRSVVTWGPGEEALAESAAARAGAAAVVGPATPSLPSLGHLLRRSGLVVAGDTGALHLAALLGAPTVGLFGPKDPRVYGPRGPRTAVVHKGLDCSGCPKRTCPDPTCMTTITSDEVLTAARGLLEREPAGAVSR